MLLQFGERCVILVRWRLDITMHPANEFGRICMLLSAVAETIEAKIPQVCSFSGKGLAMPVHAILQNFVKSFATESAACILKEFIAQFRIESDSFKELAVAIAGNS